MPSDSDLEKSLFPSQWTKRFDSPESALEHVDKYWKEESERNAEFLKKANVRYGPGVRQLLDIYFKNEENGTPIILFIHGGYWQEFSKDLAAFWLTPYLEKGFRVITAGYDLCPNVSLSELVDEIKSAIKYTLKYAAETNTTKISVIGHSAGAHLAITVMDDEIVNIPNASLIRSVFLVAGIYDLSLVRDTSVNENNLLKLDESDIVKLSPTSIDYKHLSAKDIKVYVCSAEHDSPLFVEQAKDLDQHLKDLGVKSELKCVKQVDHFNIMEEFIKPDYDLTQMLIDSLEA